MNDALALEAVRKTVTVECSAEEAFRLFTEGIATWWPKESHSIHGDAVANVVLEPYEGGEVYEVADDGGRARWATVVGWEPPTRLVLSWEVNPRVQGTEVEVRFVREAGTTLVELEHRGWETAYAAERDSYETGWGFVLGEYVEKTG